MGRQKTDTRFKCAVQAFHEDQKAQWYFCWACVLSYHSVSTLLIIHLGLPISQYW